MGTSGRRSRSVVEPNLIAPNLLQAPRLQLRSVAEIKLSRQCPLQTVEDDLGLREDRRNPPDVLSGLALHRLLGEPHPAACSLAGLDAGLDQRVAVFIEDGLKLFACVAFRSIRSSSTKRFCFGVSPAIQQQKSPLVGGPVPPNFGRPRSR